MKLAKQKKKKIVDTRASKGRKIRYHIHEKIQNFMAPEPRGNWHEGMSEELFGSLLGISQESDQNERLASDGFKILA